MLCNGIQYWGPLQLQTVKIILQNVCIGLCYPFGTYTICIGTNRILPWSFLYPVFELSVPSISKLVSKENHHIPTNVESVVQDFRYAKDLLVFTEPKFVLFTDTNHLTVLQSAKSPAPHLSLRQSCWLKPYRVKSSLSWNMLRSTPLTHKCQY